eukprot:UN02304
MRIMELVLVCCGVWGLVRNGFLDGLHYGFLDG